MLKISESKSKIYNFNYGWKFLLADAFPLKVALDKHIDKNGRYFYEPDYLDGSWEGVSVPHTFNDRDMFVNRIEDAGTGQKRTFSFYRKEFDIPQEQNGKKVIIEFEGIRQTCFLYINGKMAGFFENGVAPFGFDLTPYIIFGGKNLIAVATDNTSTRQLNNCAAETPNHPDAVPGNFMTANFQGSREEIEAAQGSVPEFQKGVGYFWNCNDFNPSIGGLSKNIKLHIKPKVYLTLNLYTNLQTKGVYVFADDFDIKGRKVKVNVTAEVRNETGGDVSATFESYVVDKGRAVCVVKSAPFTVGRANLPELPPLTITPKDAYTYTDGMFAPVEDEGAVAPTVTDSVEVTVASAASSMEDVNFWSINTPYLYDVYTVLKVDGEVMDVVKTTTGFRQMTYDPNDGLYINGERTWLTGYAQRSANEWAAIGAATDWLKDLDAKLMRESNANHVRWMHVAACPADIRSCDRYGVANTQPAGDKERENFGRQWDQRVELMRDVIIYFRNSPSILFWEVGNNAVNLEHMREMTLLRKELDPSGGRWMGCRTINKAEVVQEAEWVGTMLNRHAGRFQSELMPILETEYAREESPRRVWDDYSPPDFDYDNSWAGRGGKKATGVDVHDLTAEEFAVSVTYGYAEFFNDRVGGASKKNLYSSAAALCWTDSAQHGRQSASENARMSGRVDAVRLKKQNFHMFRVMQSGQAEVMVLGHWNYPKEDGINYRYPIKKFESDRYVKTGEFAFRDPKNKTIYVAASYKIAKVELFVNGVSKGVQDKPIATFIYKFDGIDVTEQGYIEAKGYDFDGNIVTSHKIETVSEPAQIRLTPHTGCDGFIADGADLMYFDIEILDKEGRICPLCYDRIDFKADGAVFLGGYNSGKFNGFGKEDSVIHQTHVYAECGKNRVFLRSLKSAGDVKLTATLGGLTANASLTSKAADISPLSELGIHTLEPFGAATVPYNDFTFDPIEAADAVKYEADKRVFVSVVINDGHEVSRVEFMDGALWGPIIMFLDRIKGSLREGALEYEYDASNRILHVKSGNNEITARYGYTHLIVNGDEVLMGGEPTLHRDMFWMEINHIIPRIKGVKAAYDSGANVYRVDVGK
jgi:beta-galactosidase